METIERYKANFLVCPARFDSADYKPLAFEGIYCAYCVTGQKIMGIWVENPYRPLEHKNVSSGICPKCFKRETEKRIAEEILDKDSI